MRSYRQLDASQFGHYSLFLLMADEEGLQHLLGEDYEMVLTQPLQGLSRCVRRADIEAFQVTMQQRFTNMECTVKAANKRALFKERGPRQIQQNDRQSTRWKRLLMDIETIAPHDYALLQMSNELRDQECLTSCGMLGYMPERKKRRKWNDDDFQDVQTGEYAFPEHIQVFVKTLRGRPMLFEISPDESVDRFRQMVYDSEGVSAENTRMVFQNRQLENGSTVGDCGITQDSTVLLLANLNGGVAGVTLFDSVLFFCIISFFYVMLCYMCTFLLLRVCFDRTTGKMLKVCPRIWIWFLL
jgi:hypothetical protein